MKNKLLILSLFCWFGAFGQSVPNTTTFRFTQVAFAVHGDSASGRNLADAFTNSDAAKFDATYGSKTMSPKTMLGFRNYGGLCTRPGGLTTGVFYFQVNGVAITVNNVQYYVNNFSCTSTCLSRTGQSTFAADGVNVYYTNYLTDCSTIADGYYVVAVGANKYPYRIISGLIYYVYS